MPVDASLCHRLLDEYAPAIARALALDDYDLQLRVESVSEGRKATGSMNDDYLWIRVVIDPNQHDDEEDVLDSIRHELVHGLHESWTTYSLTMQAAVGDAWPAGLDDQQYRLAAERFTRRMERLLDRHGLSPRTLSGLDA